MVSSWCILLGLYSITYIYLTMQADLKAERLSRNEFLKKLGFGGASLLAVYCASFGLSSCANESDGVTPSGTVDFTLNLEDSANVALKTNGGYVISNNVVVAKTNNGDYAAVTLICSHEGERKVTYRTDRFYCTEHGAEYDNNGKGLNSNGSKGLTVYQTFLSNNQLRVFS